jgi:hypothetical protein
MRLRPVKVRRPFTAHQPKNFSRLLSISVPPVRRNGDGPDRRVPTQEETIVAEYLVLIYEDEAGYTKPGAWEEAGTAHAKFGENNAGAIRGGNALQPTSTSTSIRTDSGGGQTVTDGPFAETKEALGGYYLIEAADLDEAIAIAKQVPTPFGGVEVRPILVLG